MKCSILKHKSAKDNTKQFIAEVGGLKSFNSNEIADYKIFMDATKQLEQQSIRSYGVSGRPWLADDNGFTAVPNYRVLRQIDNVRKRMGLYEDKLPVGARPKEDSKYQVVSDATPEQYVATEKTIRELAVRMADRIGISVVFENNPYKKYKGKLEDNTAYINLAYATLDTSIHEILGHPIIRTILKSKPELYQSLLKELETGRGKEVLDRIKRDYKSKSAEGVFKTTSNGKNYTIIYGEGNILTGLYLVEERLPSGEINYIGNFDIDNLSQFGFKLPEYTLEEQQEEAIVELLGLYTADRLNVVKDGKLINLLKRLLKEIKDFMRSLLRQREVDIDKLPDNMTLGDLADLLAYSNSKLILPGYEVVYTTPDNQKFKTYAEASKHISDLAKNAEQIDVDTINVDLEENKNRYSIIGFDEDGGDILFKDNLTKEEAEEEVKKRGEGYYVSISENSVQNFIERNNEYELSKEIVEEWKRVNNIQYNPDEVYSRNQEFVSVLGAYSNFDAKLLLQNLLFHIEDNQKAGGEFIISAITKPIDKRLHHLEGKGGKIRFKIYPQPNDIKWAADTDVYSGSVWNASSKIAKDKRPELLGVSYSKYPNLNKLSFIQPNLASIIDNLADHHNELGIALTGSNFRLEYDEDIPSSTKKIIDSVNSILDRKYGKVVKPESTTILKQPTQTNETLKENFQEIRAKVATRRGYSWGVLPTTDVIGFENQRGYLVVDFGGASPTREIFRTQEEAQDWIYSNTPKEVPTQAFVNIKIAKIKEVAKKYPRILIASEVVQIDNTPTEIGLFLQKVSEPQYSLDTVDRTTKRKIDPEVVRQQPVLVANTEEGDLRGTVIKTEKLSNIVFNNQLAPTVNKLLEIGDPDIIFVKDLNFSTIREYSVSVSAINGVHFTDTGKIYVEFDNPNALKTVLHEAIHFFTVAKMQSNPNDPAVKKLVSLFESYQLVGSATLADTNYSKYGLKDAYEFIAEAFSNPEFVETLKYLAPSVNDNSRSFFQMFIDFVAELLGIKRDPLEEILNAGWEIIRKDLPVNRDIKGYQQMPEPSEQEEVSQQINTVESRIPINERAFKVQTKVRQDINRIISGEIFEVEEDTTRVIYSLLDDRLKQELTAEGITSENFNKNFNSQLQKLVGDSWFARILEYIKQLFTRDRLYLLARSIQTQQVSPLFTEKGKMLIYGITSNQGKKTIPLINEMLYRSITPANYKIGRVLGKAGQSLFVGKSYEDFIETISKWREQDLATNELTENKLIPEWATKMSRESYNKREDAWRLSNGLPQKHNSFKYIGRGFLDREANLIPDENGEDIYGFVNPQFNEKDIARDLGIDKTNAVMGKYAIKIGKDNLGHYIQYNDRWDLDILNPIINKVVDLTQTPFIITGKIYKALDYDPDSQVPFLYYTHDETDPNIQAYTAQVDLLNEEEFLAEKLYEISQPGIDNIYYQLIDNKVDYQLRIVTALQSDKVRQPKINNLQGFFNDIQKQGIPSNQLDLLREIISQKQGGFTKEDLVVNLLSDYSYTVEVSTSKLQEANTQYYSNLTVPGGTNYTENEIATPSITPSIKGHAQFSTAQGIGWFRSDDKVTSPKDPISEMSDEELRDLAIQAQMSIAEVIAAARYRPNAATDSKTRRIIEVQSDLFQKGRANENLINEYSEEYQNIDGNTIEEIIENRKNIKSNQFLQLLNKDSNWVTFFVRAIIQSTAKERIYEASLPDIEEKVLSLQKEGKLKIDCR